MGLTLMAIATVIAHAPFSSDLSGPRLDTIVFRDSESDPTISFVLRGIPDGSSGRILYDSEMSMIALSVRQQIEATGRIASEALFGEPKEDDSLQTQAEYGKKITRAKQEGVRIKIDIQSKDKKDVTVYYWVVFEKNGSCEMVAEE